MSTTADWVVPGLVAILGTSGVAGLIKLFQRPDKDTLIADASNKTVSTLTRAMEELDRQRDHAEKRAAKAEQALREFQERFGDRVTSDAAVQQELAGLRRQVEILTGVLQETERKLAEVRAQLASYQDKDGKP